ncbi:hypothetical protein Vadar_019960 [Vaccinium darrowii]|uniref:Uncharacterized protein n=1 Tax=Vaccinium darrowii TaxID=229202 RepID=A0ACB7ZLA4_9ERIC|nr:hypothetical protein Vadar_019960 [Vaccinium darrowii]
MMKGGVDDVLTDIDENDGCASLMGDSLLSRACDDLESNPIVSSNGDSPSNCDSFVGESREAVDFFEDSAAERQLGLSRNSKDGYPLVDNSIGDSNCLVMDGVGFISIDCGIPEGSNYTDKVTNISYTSDAGYVDTGTNHSISSVYLRAAASRQLYALRSFTKGIKNCYTIKLAQADQGNKYLIRAIFMYGNYDFQNEPPVFELYLDGNQWDTIKFWDASDIFRTEIIHVPATAYIHVCLVKNGSGIPFISALELRPLDNSTYQTESGSLKLFNRVDVGSPTDESISFRYPDDPRDRIWYSATSAAFTRADWEPIRAPYNSSMSSYDIDDPPSSVMVTAVRPVNGSDSLDFHWEPEYQNQQIYVYFYFAEIEQLKDGQLREFQIYLNNEPSGPVVNPIYLQLSTIYSPGSVPAGSRLNFSIGATDNSTLPPILNAFEIYEVLLLQSPTNQSEVDAIRKIKSVYRVEKNWQGDPCVPKEYPIWDGLQCNYDSNSPTIISLNLSSSSLSGNMDISFSDLKSLESLDLSNNNLIGQVPDFLSRLPFLKTLNLSHNNFTGSVPSALIEKSKTGSLTLSTEGNLRLCLADSCAKKKAYAVPVIASIASSLAIGVVILAIWCSLERKKQREDIVKSNAEDEMVEKNRHFTYSELITITNNFQKVLGKGASGSVYGGHLTDRTQVAVKMLSPQSTQGPNHFRTEAQLLTRIHHRNLVSIIGFCNDGTHMGLIYEYMANGTVREHLSGKNSNILSWKGRLRIACDAAEGLEYLHNGCKPPIIHRDIKTVNILLAENMEAKISDFGISRLMPLDGGPPVATTVAGTPGYIDPEYLVSNELNEKSDVYSFGIVLLELITGKPPVLRTHEDTHIVKWVRPMVERTEIKEIVDSRLNGDFGTNSAWKVAETAMACVEQNSIQRPAMRQVVAELRECVEMEIDRVKDQKENEVYNSASGSSFYVSLGS